MVYRRRSTPNDASEDNIMNKLIQRFYCSIVLLTVSSTTIARIILALAERQPNGRCETEAEPYFEAKRIAKLLPIIKT